MRFNANPLFSGILVNRLAVGEKGTTPVNVYSHQYEVSPDKQRSVPVTIPTGKIIVTQPGKDTVAFDGGEKMTAIENAMKPYQIILGGSLAQDTIRRTVARLTRELFQESNKGLTPEEANSVNWPINSIRTFSFNTTKPEETGHCFDLEFKQQ